MTWYDDPSEHAEAMQRELDRMPGPSLNPCEHVERLTEKQQERIRTLEDALRPFAVLADEEAHGYDTDAPDDPMCISCHEPRPCKYEKARRALESTDVQAD